MLRKYLKMTAVSILLPASVMLAQSANTITVKSRLSTSQVVSDADDAAIWMHPTDPSKSLILGTDKGGPSTGGLVAWNLDGTQKQRLTLNRPNNVDVRYGFKLGGQTVDLAAASLRDSRKVRIFKIDPSSRKLSDVTTLDTTNVLHKMFESPYGLTMYKRPSDGLIYVIVSSRHINFRDKLWQIRLEDDGAGRVKGVLVRAFGDFKNVVEGMVADDELGFFYASEERVGIHKYNADPKQGNNPLAFFSTEDSLHGNNEGLALYKCTDGTGYILVAHPETRSIKVYRREGEKGAPHLHRLLTRIMDDSSKAGDGLEVSSRAYSPIFPRGVMIWHDQAGRNFRLYAWEDVAKNILAICEGVTTSVETDATGSIDNPAPALLQQNSPNPFNPETEIRFVLKKAGTVKLTIYNLLGEEVKDLLSASLTPGTYTVRWDAKDNKGSHASSGIYFYQLRVDQVIETRRMVLLR
ncbi:MAG: phytase [candidate division KSB1 bacterium]|nr:phytase [candidate division KSB1 bacterium]MDZ7364300.1 phytase [candidate division KSB1 bacterium]MDZ7405023.1 phytase [candidate division KSB1 bacterium]